MVATRADIEEEWRSFYREHRRDAIRDLAGAYPDERSLYVDIVDLHRHDPSFAEALLAEPDTVLAAGRAALRRLDDAFDRVNVRVQNHPGMLAPSAVRSKHVGELVAVQGVVDDIGPIRARLTDGVYECRDCGADVRHDENPEPPLRCGECRTADAMALDRERSSFVDVRRVALADLAAERSGADDPPTVDVFLDDDLVDAVDPGEQLLATGIVRLEDRDGRRFDFSIEGSAVNEERPGGAEDESRPSEALQDVIDSRWRRAGDDP